MRKHHKWIILSSFIVLALVGGTLLLPYLQPILNPTSIGQLSFSTGSPQSLSFVAGPLSNRLLPCTITGAVQAFYTDGTFDTILTNSAQFYPNVVSGVAPASIVLQNPSNSKTVNYFQVTPQLSCNMPYSYAQSAQLSGSYTFYYYFYYQNGAQFSRTPLSTTTVNLTPMTFNSGQTINVGIPQRIQASTVVSQLPNTATGVGLVTFLYPNFSFYIPSVTQTSTWTGQLYFTNFGLNIKSTGTGTTTAPPPPPNPTPTTAVNLNSKIQYKIFYLNGKTQAGIASDVQAVSLKTLSTVAINSPDLTAPSPVTDIVYTILIDSGGLGVNLSNPAMTLGGTVTVGGNQPFALTASDFKPTVVNDINFGLMTIDLPVANLQNEIQSHVGAPTNSQQQVSVTLTTNGQFTASYNGNTYTGTINNLSWTFPTLYGNTGSTGSSTAGGGSGCASGQGSAGINPNGGSPSSGQSFNCGGGNANCNFGTNPSTNTCNPSVGFASIECGGGVWGINGCGSATTTGSGGTTTTGTGSTGTGGTGSTSGGNGQQGSAGDPSQICFLASGIANPLAGPQCSNGSSGSPSGSSGITNNPNNPPYSSGGSTTGFCTDGAQGLACLSELLGNSGFNTTTIMIYGILIVIAIVASVIVIKFRKKN